MSLLPGKLPPLLLRGFLASLPAPGPPVIVGGAIGEDAAVIDLGGPEFLVAKTDPITFAAENAGRYLVAVNSNDLATMGAEPKWLMVSALLPENTSEESARRILGSLADACLEFGISLVGGHTEITVGLDRPILVGSLLGTVPRDGLIRTAGALPGDAVVLTGGIAIEGTAILASEHSGMLLRAGVPPEVVRRAANWLQNPGISVLPAARILRTFRTIHSMHDPTEGGLATALREVAEAATAGVQVDLEAVPVLPESRIICDALGLDPFGLLASGALLATLDAAEAHPAIRELERHGIPAAVIGHIAPRGEDSNLPSFDRDELARFLSP